MSDGAALGGSWTTRSRRIATAELRLRRPSSLIGFAIAGGILVFLLSVPGPRNPDFPEQFDGARSAATTLRADAVRSDFAADYVGARALLDRRDPYPQLGRAFARVGLDWPIDIRSTHPPTAEVLALPLAGLSWKTATTVWAWLMLLALVLSAWAFGLRLPWAAAATMVAIVLWPPAAWSLLQLTPLWLLGAALAWRWRRRPLPAGLAVGLAAATKLTPVVLLGPFLPRRRRWAVLAGCAAFAVLALAPALVLYPGSIGRFLAVTRSEGALERSRPDNGALLPAAYHHWGALGLAASILLVAVVLATARPAGPTVGAEEYWKWLWLSVALIPLAWIYSLLPLLPVLLRGLFSRRLACVLAAGVALVLPAAAVPYGDASAPYVALTIAFAGISLLLRPGAPGQAEACP